MVRFISEETKKKISNAHKGMHNSERARKKISGLLKGRKLSEEHKRNISISLMGHHISEETKKKISESNMNKKMSLEAKRKMSEKKKHQYICGRRPWNCGMTGCYSLSEETKLKMSMARKGKHMSAEARRKLSEFHMNLPPEKHSQWKGGEKLAIARKNYKRRQLGFVSLNQGFEGNEGHHIDKEHVIFVPKEIHRAIKHDLNKSETMERINTKVYCWILGMDN